MFDVTTGTSVDNKVHVVYNWQDVTKTNLLFGTGDMFMTAVQCVNSMGTYTNACAARFESGVWSWGVCAPWHHGVGLAWAGTTNDEWFWGIALETIKEMFIGKMTTSTMNYSFGTNYGSSDYTPNHMEWYDDWLMWATSTTYGVRVLVGRVDFTGGTASAPDKNKRSMIRPY